MPAVEQRLSFRMFYFMTNEHEIIVKLEALPSVHGGAFMGVQGVKALKKFDLFTSGGQINSLK